MDAIIKPRNAQEVEQAVAWAAAEREPLEVVGQGSKRKLGRPIQAAHVLDLSALSGVESYEPAELVLTVKAGTPISEVQKLVDDNGQELSFEPADYGPIFGEDAGKGTIGGVLSANISGPRRIKAGAGRDHILGLEAVSGRGEIFKSGGKVVKNVTGYDLPRSLCGAFGTLAVATSITLKVNPKAETSATFQISGLDDERGVAALCEAMGSSAEVSAAAHLPAWHDQEQSRTILRLEGFKSSVDYRFNILTKLLANYGEPIRLDEEDSVELWRKVRDQEAFVGHSTPLWRISVAPTAGPKLIASLSDAFAFEHLYEWSGGQVWLNCTDNAAHDHEIRQAVEHVGGGHATLFRADPSARTQVPVFQPQPGPLASLTKRLKQQFDPNGILNPGRMVAGV